MSTDTSDSSAVVRGDQAWVLMAIPADGEWWELVAQGLTPRTVVVQDQTGQGRPSLLMRVLPDDWWAVAQAGGGPRLTLYYLVRTSSWGEWSILSQSDLPQGLLLSPDHLVETLESVTSAAVSAELASGLLHQMGGE